MPELKAAKVGIMTFTKTKVKGIFIHVRMDKMVALSCLMKVGGTKIQELVTISKEIWDYLLLHKITITTKILYSVPYKYFCSYRVPNRGVECRKPTRNPGFKRFQRMETEPTSVQ